MREIKFRAWDGERMRESFLLHQANGEIPILQMGATAHLERMVDWRVMQYTGLKDKNGTDIYEGDVCEIEGGGEKTSVGEIVFEYGCFCFKPNGARFGTAHPELKYYVDMEFCEIEVIGNIYENPDLLNEPVSNTNKLD